MHPCKERRKRHYSRVDYVYSHEQNHERDVEEIKKHIHCQPQARSFRLGSSHVSPEHPLVRRAVALGRTPFGSPTLSDQALMPFPSMKMGPGKSARSHTADEFIFVKEIEEAIGLYLELLDGAEL